MWNGALGISKWCNRDVPFAKVVLLHLVRVAAPTVKVTNERGLDGVGCPLGVGDCLRLWVDLEAHVAVGTGKFLEAAFGLVDGVEPIGVD